MKESTKTAQNAEDMGGIPARVAAVAALDDILLRKRSLDEALVTTNDLEQSRDRAFARLLVTIVLRRMHQIDAYLETLLHEPISKLKPPTLLNILRLGIAQISFLETPAHAAVSTMVETAEKVGISHQKPLVNAVLRRAAREPMPKMDARDAGRLNTPDWLWQELMRDYGVEQALDILAAHLQEAAIDITVKENPAHWASVLDADLLPTGSLRRKTGGFIPGLPGFQEGEWWIQNAAASLPAKLMGNAKGKRIIDLCAAPGGKTAQLASMGAHVIAVDRSAIRMERLKENIQRLRLDVETVVADGGAWKPSALVDAVLLDAPCTATGTIRHQPDVFHLKTPADQEKLAVLQRRLIENAARMIKPGGMLIYCTCSLQKTEGENQIAWVLAQNFGLSASPITNDELSGIEELLDANGHIRALPCYWENTGGIDGFFIARLVKS